MTEHSMRVALITGVTGQDGAYLAELLLSKGYEVHGIKRRSSSFNTGRIEHIYQDPHVEDPKLHLHYGDMTDSTNLIRIIQAVRPTEIYNLAAQSHVQVSFETPEYTANSDAIGTLRLLEAIRILGMETTLPLLSGIDVGTLRARPGSAPARDGRPFIRVHLTPPPSSMPIGSSSTIAKPMGCMRRTAFLFNHESPIRGETFVTRKITRATAAIKLGLQSKLYLGNLDAKRDWGHAREYVRGMWLMLQQDTPDDYVLATGKTTTVRQFVEWAFADIGISIDWQGVGVDERGICKATGNVIVEVDARYFRPTEVDLLIGDPTKAYTKLGWQHETSIRSLVTEMVEADLRLVEHEQRGSSFG